MGSTYSRMMDGLYLASIWFAGLAILVMSLIIPWGVFTRYVLGTGSQWPEPIAILLMMVFTFVGAAAAYRAGAHIAVDLLAPRLPPGPRRALVVLVDVLMAAVSAYVVYFGTSLCIATWHQSISELPWLPVGLTYASLPIGAAITLLFVVERTLLGPQDARAIVRYDEGLAETPQADT